MHDVVQLIRQAWDGVKPRLLADPHELARRLARRRKPLLTRPPRAWCLAIRASDTRINPAIASMVPEDAADPHDLDHPGRVLEHEVTLDAEGVGRLCRPVRIASPGEPHDAVAKKLGVHPAGLIASRLGRVFQTHHLRGIAGRHGKPVPMLFTDRPLDPGAKGFQSLDPLWGFSAEVRTCAIPDDLCQTLKRVPLYCAAAGRRFADHRHPEEEFPERVSRRRRMPPPEPDYVWYKWSKSGQYLGDDPRYWRKSFDDPGIPPPPGPSRADRRRQREREYRRNHPRPSKASGSLHFVGWLWICPACGKTARTIYLPLPVLDLETAQLPALPGLHPADQVPRPISCFACKRCHRVQFSTRLSAHWNEVIAHLSGGLVYGREVPLPQELRANSRRKRAYRPQTNRPAPRRRQVLNRLLNGWSIRQIARDLGISPDTVGGHVRILCRQERVPDRHALIKKLGSVHQSPLNSKEIAHARLARVQELILAGRSYKQIMNELGTDYATVNRDIVKIYKSHRVHGRAGLAKKLGITLLTAGMKIREQIRSLRAAGMTCAQIASELEMSYNAVEYQVRIIRHKGKTGRVRLGNLGIGY